MYYAGSSLDTLELTSEISLNKLDFKGNGSSLGENLYRRNGSKIFSGRLIMYLINLHTADEDKYRYTYYSSHVVTKQGDSAKFQSF